MKTSLTFKSFFASFSASVLILAAISSAQADYAPGYLRSAKLTKIRMDPGYSIEPTGGMIHVNTLLNQVKLKLQLEDHCGELACTEISDISYELPIVLITQDDCGTVKTTALKDDRPVDGLLHEIVILDHSQVICKRLYPAQTEIQHRSVFVSRMTGKRIERVSTFQAEKLRSPMDE